MIPKLSIVIANYNYGRFLEEAIQSVITQDGFDECELIVVDGGSTDGSVEIIKKYVGKITWWCSEKDNGQSDAFNKGFAHARGEFLTWLNADDIFTRGALHAILNLMARHPHKEWFTGSSLYTDENLIVTKCFCAHRFSILRAKFDTIYVGGPSSFFTKRMLDAVGGIDEELHYCMDNDLWHKFYQICGARYVRTRKNIFAYRQHEASKMSGADSHTTERAIENRKRANREMQMVVLRYNRTSHFMRKVVRAMSSSPIDFIIAKFREKKWRGLHATEI